MLMVMILSMKLCASFIFFYALQIFYDKYILFRWFSRVAKIALLFGEARKVVAYLFLNFIIC